MVLARALHILENSLFKFSLNKNGVVDNVGSSLQLIM